MIGGKVKPTRSLTISDRESLPMSSPTKPLGEPSVIWAATRIRLSRIETSPNTPSFRCGRVSMSRITWLIVNPEIPNGVIHASWVSKTIFCLVSSKTTAVEKRGSSSLKMTTLAVQLKVIENGDGSITREKSSNVMTSGTTTIVIPKFETTSDSAMLSPITKRRGSSFLPIISPIKFKPKPSRVRDEDKTIPSCNPRPKSGRESKSGKLGNWNPSSVKDENNNLGGAILSSSSGLSSGRSCENFQLGGSAQVTAYCHCPAIFSTIAMRIPKSEREEPIKKIGFSVSNLIWKLLAGSWIVGKSLGIVTEPSKLSNRLIRLSCPIFPENTKSLCKFPRIVASFPAIFTFPWIFPNKPLASLWNSVVRELTFRDETPSGRSQSPANVAPKLKLLESISLLNCKLETVISGNWGIEVLKKCWIKLDRVKVSVIGVIVKGACPVTFVPNNPRPKKRLPAITKVPWSTKLTAGCPCVTWEPDSINVGSSSVKNPAPKSRELWSLIVNWTVSLSGIISTVKESNCSVARRVGRKVKSLKSCPSISESRIWFSMLPANLMFNPPESTKVMTTGLGMLPKRIDVPLTEKESQFCSF